MELAVWAESRFASWQARLLGLSMRAVSRRRFGYRQNRNPRINRPIRQMLDFANNTEMLAGLFVITRTSFATVKLPHSLFTGTRTDKSRPRNLAVRDGIAKILIQATALELKNFVGDRLVNCLHNSVPV